MLMTPEFLYRYCSFAEERVKPIFTQNKIYFSCPKEFNDPFDCQLPFPAVGSREEKIKDIAGMICRQRGIASANLEQIKQELVRIENLGNEYQRAVDDVIKNDVASEFGILSFSEKNDDLLMWSHYAYKHQGFCLEFKNNEEFFGEYAVKVVYTTECPEFNFLERDPENIKKFHTTKGKQWEYEQEWRVVRVPTPASQYPLQNGKGHHEFPPEILTGVIFGLNMKDEDELKIRNWVKENKWLTDLHFHKARKKEREFALEIVPAKDS